MLKVISSLFISCALLATHSTAAEEIYKHVDESGVPVFSDSSGQDAEKIIVDPVNIQEMPAVRNIQPLHKPSEAVKKSPYTRLAISNPADQTTLHNQPKIILSAIIEPALYRSHKLEFLDNGQALQPASKETSLVLNYFERGTHTLSVRVIDDNGREIQSSSPVTVYIFRNTVKPSAPAS